jgi:hypothetical protein
MLAALHGLYVAERKEVREGRHFVRRIPESVSWACRLQYFGEAINTFTPDVASLQYVPFAYDRWGFAPDLAALQPPGLPVIAFRLEGRARPPVIHRVEQVIPADDTLDPPISCASKLPP